MISKYGNKLGGHPHSRESAYNCALSWLKRAVDDIEWIVDERWYADVFDGQPVEIAVRALQSAVSQLEESID